MARILMTAYATYVVACSGCQVAPDALATGCQSMDELVDCYTLAHQEKDLRRLRSICFWNAQSQSYFRRDDLEGPMAQLFDLKLMIVTLVKFPSPTPGRPSMVYARTRGGQRPQRDGMIGPVYGKLILLGKGSESSSVAAVTLDPGYGVVLFQGRYFIDVLPLVVEDAVDALKSGKPSRSVAVDTDA